MLLTRLPRVTRYIFLLSPITRKLNLKYKVPTVTYYKARPECLVYLTHLFHVADIKVLITVK